jgi:hypothetical protein
MAHTLSTTSSDSQVTKPKPDSNKEYFISKKFIYSNLDDVLFVYQSLT